MKRITPEVLAEARRQLSSQGGKARASKLTDKQRQEIARKGGKAKAAKRAAKGETQR